MNRSLQRLDDVHQKLLDTVTPLDSELFMQRPSDREWSVGEIVQHLYLVEDRVIKDLKRAIDSEPGRVSFVKKLIPTYIVSLRVRKFQSPKAVKPVDVPAKDQVLTNYNVARQSLKELCRSQSRERFKTLVFNHPFLGPIDGTMTVSFVGYHELRHLKQIREVLKKLSA
ncbi:MAG TPA: DinB family protein [Pyrinomonadaceae bacterium]|nr:DinB family protein [Pyrinomonadaceae bacterium]